MQQHLLSLLEDASLNPLEASFALRLDALLGPCRRDAFHLPVQPATGQPLVYLCGNSLGLQPKRSAGCITEELSKWGALGVEGHFTAPRPWVSIDECVSPGLAALAGALPSEVVPMNTLSGNLHTLLCSFYRPSGRRTRILMEEGAFPSDAHIAQSQAALHGLDPAATLLRLPSTRSTAEVVAAIQAAGDTLALVLLPGVQYYTGQLLDIAAITAAAAGVGAVAGWDLAHAMGNAPLQLHAWGVDFAVWCSYKYLNAGPGAIGGVFVHERHGAGGAGARPRLAGWWGHTKGDRFDMREDFVASPGAQGYQLSNPCVLSIAALRGSLEEFEAAGGVPALRQRSSELTGYLQLCLCLSGLFVPFEDRDQERAANTGLILTPSSPLERGCQLSLQVPQLSGCPTLDGLCKCLREDGVIVDERKVRGGEGALPGWGGQQEPACAYVGSLPCFPPLLHTHTLPHPRAFCSLLSYACPLRPFTIQLPMSCTFARPTAGHSSGALRRASCTRQPD